MALKPLAVAKPILTIEEQFTKLAAGLKSGQCYLLSDVAADIGRTYSSTHGVARRLGLVHLQPAGPTQRNVSVLINPKHRPDS